MGPLKGMGLFLALILVTFYGFLVLAYCIVLLIKGHSKLPLNLILIADILSVLIFWGAAGISGLHGNNTVGKFLDRLNFLPLILFSLLVYLITGTLIFSLLKLLSKQRQS